MPQGKCLKCGAKWYGWALIYQLKPTCQHCGGEIQIVSK